MSIFRRLSFVGICSEEPPTPHRHHHHLHRNQKNYDVSPTGGNRPIAIPVGPQTSVLSLPDASAPPEKRRSSRHRLRSDTAGAPVRKHRSRSDAADAPVRKHSSRSKKHRREIDPESPAELASPTEPPSAPDPVSAPEVDMSNRMSSSPPSGSSMAIVISGRRERRDTDGSTSSTPLITATPPTPSPLEQARRSGMHPSFPPPPDFSAPPPYPISPPTPSNGEDYIAYAVSKMAVDTPEQHSLLHRYRSTFDHHAGPAELSSEPAPVEIGSSDSIYQPPKPPRMDPEKSLNNSKNTTAAKQPGVSRRNKGSLRENQYEFLRTFDTVFVIDDSASMDAFTRWADTRAALETVATIATKYDSDGIDIHFLNSTHYDARNVRSAAEVRRLFDQVRPAGITPIAACLDGILRDYLGSYAAARQGLSSPPTSPVSPGFRAPQYPKPLNIIVLTDGEPTDDPESVIVDAARRLDALNAPLSQVGIQFFQIGDEEGAREALEDLDDALAEIYGIRDMVDYTPYIGQRGREEVGDGEALTGEWILKALVGAVNRRLDRWENDHGKRREMEKRM